MADEVKVLGEQIAALSKDVTGKDAQIAALTTQLKDVSDARTKLHGELTDSLVSQYTSMRRVLKNDLPTDEKALKELTDKLKLRSVESLRDAINDLAPDFAKKVDELLKGKLADSAGKVADPLTPPAGNLNDAEKDKGKVKTAKDRL